MKNYKQLFWGFGLILLVIYGNLVEIPSAYKRAADQYPKCPMYHESIQVTDQEPNGYSETIMANCPVNSVPNETIESGYIRILSIPALLVAMLLFIKSSKNLK